MTERILGISLFVCFASVIPVIAADSGPAEDVPELKALAHYIGNWESKIESREAPFVSAEVTAEWILEGRFVQQTATLQVINSSKPLKITTLMTYDPDRQQYRFWRFVSNGNVTESSGSWDAKTSTMTSKGKDGDVAATTTASFAKEGVEEWKITVKDSSGNDVATIEGTNTRKK